MDTITHTLVGVALAESGLKRATPLATATLMIGANLPDLDVLTYLVGSEADALGFRRGWTHGILAMLVLPPLLAAVAWGWPRITGRGGGDERVLPLLGIAAIAVWSHPLLDLLNVYGVRLLMPFSERWFHGDGLFIVDPWVWAVLLAGILAAWRRQRNNPWPPRVSLGVVAGYAIAMVISGRIGARVIEAQTGSRFRTMVAPAFADPFRRAVIRDLGGRYEVGILRWGSAAAYSVHAVVPAGRDQPGAAEAARTAAGTRFLAWARFPRFESGREDGGTRVTISDLRYAGRGGTTWASITVLVP